LNSVTSLLDCDSIVEISIGDMFLCGLEILIYKPEISENGSPSIAETG